MSDSTNTQNQTTSPPENSNQNHIEEAKIPLLNHSDNSSKPQSEILISTQPEPPPETRSQSFKLPSPPMPVQPQINPEPQIKPEPIIVANIPEMRPLPVTTKEKVLDLYEDRELVKTLSTMAITFCISLLPALLCTYLIKIDSDKKKQIQQDSTIVLIITGVIWLINIGFTTFTRLNNQILIWILVGLQAIANMIFPCFAVLAVPLFPHKEIIICLQVTTTASIIFMLGCHFFKLPFYLTVACILVSGAGGVAWYLISDGF